MDYEPKWNGVVIDDIEITGKIFAWSPQLNMPLLVMVNGCDDRFLALYSEEESLRAGVKWIRDQTESQAKIEGAGFSEETVAAAIQFQMELYDTYTIKKVDDGRDFCESIWEGGVRIMLDPEFINANHSKWKEIVRDKSELVKQLRTDLN